MQTARQEAAPPKVNIELDDIISGSPQELQDVSLFKDLSPEELRWIHGEMRIKQKKTGEKLMVQGQPVSAIYIIRQGLVDILVNDDRVAQRGSMDSLGEMSCFSGEETASATVIAVTPCQVWEISRMAFLIIIDAIPTLRSKMFSTITNRLKTLSHRFSEILKHIPHGIVKIDLEGFITDEYSSRCTDYLGITQLAGSNLGELLFTQNPVLLKQWRHGIQSIGLSSYDHYNSELKRLPDEVIYPHPDGKTRIFKLYYHPTVNKGNRINGIDIGIDDVTESREYQSELSSFQQMMTNLEQLLVMIEIKTGSIIQETFSQSRLGDMHFPTWKNLKGKTILETILVNQDEDQLSHFQRWLKMLGNRFILETMSPEELIDLSPRFAFETQLGKVMELSFTPNQRKTDTYTEVLGRFEYVETKQETREFQTSTMELIEEVVAAETEHQTGLPEALNEMQISMEIAQSRMTTPEALTENHHQIAGIIHSVKGLGQSFGLSTVASAAHELEEVLGEILKSDQASDTTSLLITSFKSLLSLILVSKSLCNTEPEKDLGICRTRKPEIRIPLPQFQQLKQKLDEILKNEDFTALNKFRNELRSLEMMNLDTVFPRLQRIVSDTAKLLKKQVEFKTVVKVPVLINRQIGHLLHTCLIQLIKNAVYHGIETPGERRSIGKPDKATIMTVIEKKENCILVHVQDDGRGVSLQKTAKRATELDLIDRKTAAELIQANRTADILALLFEPGFSTARSISLISGRGIGMSMIKTEIESLGGSVIIKSQENRGTRICLRIPMTYDQQVL